MSKKIIILGLVSLLVLPSIVLASQHTVPGQPPQPGDNLDIWLAILKIIDLAWKIFLGISALMFIFSGYMFLIAKGDPNRIKLAKDSFVWGVVGIGVALLSTSIIWTIKPVLGV